MDNTSVTRAIKKEYSKNELSRRALMLLAGASDTPIDIFTSQFGEILESQTEYLRVETDVNLSYSCNVGYNREVKYYDSTAKCYKTKTVTDWEPFSGTNQSHEFTCVQNTDEGFKFIASSDLNFIKYTENDIVERAIEGYNINDFESIDKKMLINENAIKVAKARCESSSFCRIDLPGDCQKDKSHSGIVTVTKVEGLIVPEFSMNYKYKEREYTYKGLAFGKVTKNMGTEPSDKYAIEFAAKRKALKFLIAGIALLAVAALYLIVSFIIEVSGWLAIPDILCIIGGIVLICLYPKFKSKYAWNMQSNMKEEKIKSLNEYLLNHGESELTDEEKNYIQSNKYLDF